jgi:signal peptidase I
MARLGLGALRTVARAAIVTLICLVGWSRVPTVVGCSPVAITGGSMRPALAPGDAVVACPTHSLPGPGSIVVVDDPAHRGALLTHRVVEVDGNRLVLRGDANRDDDLRTVDRADVRGVVRLVVPWIGRPAYAITMHHWRAVLWMAALLTLLVALARPQLRPRVRRVQTFAGSPP